ncbi:MAG: hypothetical protein A2937_02550 [Candidatus Yonathbacteria bacterium RIFCSPLOWO2_01_FULL_47_33b]|uniref:Uncharacterized protein n=1 Tax=Candidatus Yonathbacteria bacterium RIFCSPLOWO2_01_FULL_47_33b TaxID=1802727 RepID=A0A1G2SG81_9BACT|nr:MAG: hypothetical protein A2937_02550 [Candidatus Yonathbacteria bacterium RIFCSPLOWO2_01_FULL_47_33b]
MEPFVILSLVIIILAFLAGKLFPFQGVIKKITCVAREEASQKMRMRTYYAADLCGVYTCVSYEPCWLPIYPKGGTLRMVVLKSDQDVYKHLKISCEETVAPGQKVHVRLRNPENTHNQPTEGYGDILEIVPLQAT